MAILDPKTGRLSADALRTYLGRGLDSIAIPTDWELIGNRGPGFDMVGSPDGKVLLWLFWTAKDGIIAAGDGWDTIVYADGWDKASVIRAMNDNLTKWLVNAIPDGD